MRTAARKESGRLLALYGTLVTPARINLFLRRSAPYHRLVGEVVMKLRESRGQECSSVTLNEKKLTNAG